MLPTTIELIKSALKTDPSVTPQDRATITAFLRNGNSQAKPSAPAPAQPPSIIRPAQAAQRLDRGVRTIHQLCQQGLLTKVRFPGRQRCAGITEESLLALMANFHGQTGHES